MFALWPRGEDGLLAQGTFEWHVSKQQPLPSSPTRTRTQRSGTRTRKRDGYRVRSWENQRLPRRWLFV